MTEEISRQVTGSVPSLLRKEALSKGPKLEKVVLFRSLRKSTADRQELEEEFGMF